MEAPPKGAARLKTSVSSPAKKQQKSTGSMEDCLLKAHGAEVSTLAPSEPLALTLLFFGETSRAASRLLFSLAADSRL